MLTLDSMCDIQDFGRNLTDSIQGFQFDCTLSMTPQVFKHGT
jgi:hypothetical protein